MFGRRRREEPGPRDPQSCGGTCGTLYDHVQAAFVGRDIEVFVWTAGPMQRHNPHFRVLRVGPSRPGDVWTYVSVGGWAETAGAGAGLELIMCTATPEERAIELVTKAAYFHRGGKLGVGAVVPVGQPWLPGSRCDRLLVSRPYPFPAELATCHVGERRVEFVWLLPITPAERDLKVAEGLEALESRFEEIGLRYWQVDRPSAV